MRHQKWMEEDERTPLQKMQDQMRHIQVQEKIAVSTLEKIREDKAKLALQIAGLVHVDVDTIQ